MVIDKISQVMSGRPWAWLREALKPSSIVLCVRFGNRCYAPSSRMSFPMTFRFIQILAGDLASTLRVMCIITINLQDRFSRLIHGTDCKQSLPNREMLSEACILHHNRLPHARYTALRSLNHPLLVITKVFLDTENSPLDSATKSMKKS